jgi:hypothetical protein
VIVKRLSFAGQAATHACDGRCDKAWGINSRPSAPSRGERRHAADPDDYAFLADDELGTAPVNPGTYEGGDAKPVDAKGPDDINKWCVRECERAWISSPGQPDAAPELPDFSARHYNVAPHRRGEGDPRV